MPGILYTAYQKFYSALSALEQFDKEKDFFDNISNLDKFFSEFRTVTLVLQKAIAHTEYKDLYDKNNKKYLSDGEKWFKNHIKIDNTSLSPDEVADMVISQYKLVANEKEEKEYRFGI